MPRLTVWLFWRRFTLRHATRDWIQSILMLAILSLGVGTFLSIRFANRSAVEGFKQFTEFLRGPSDFIVESSGAGIEVESLAVIREVLDPVPALLFPLVETSAVAWNAANPAPGEPSGRVRLLGLDLVQLQSASGPGDGIGDIWEYLGDQESVLISADLADEACLKKGDRVQWVVDGQSFAFTVGGVLPDSPDGTPLPPRLAVSDIRALLDRLERTTIDRVEVVIPEGKMLSQILLEAGQKLQELTKYGWSITTPEQQAASTASMTSAFRLNLTVLSLIALLVGLYLIAQTLDATVSRRRMEIATLRSFGVTPREIQAYWLSEAILYGILAGLLGLLAGFLLAQFTVEAVTTTVRALYHDTATSSLTIRLSDWILAMTLGLAGSLVAAWIPARDAAATPPAQFLRIGKRIPPFPLFQNRWLGWLALLAGAALLPLPPLTSATGTQISVAGYAAAFLWLAGGTLVSARLLPLIGNAIVSARPQSASFRLAGSRLAQPTSRHQLALSGFFVAIGMASSMAYLISSFDHTVTNWLQQRLRADLFISSVGFQGAESDQAMPTNLLDQIQSDTSVRELDRFASVGAKIAGIQGSVGGIRFDLLGRDQDLLWIGQQLNPSGVPPEADGIGYANENLYTKTGLSAGDSLELTTPSGTRTVWIAGLHADYASDNGQILVDLPLLESWYGIDSYSTASVFLHEDEDPATVQERWKKAFPGLAIRQNGELMRTALYIFDQTFAVTYALQAIGLFVALTGLFLSLLSLLRESAHELTLQQALGMDAASIARSTAIEGLGVAVSGLLTGILLSYALGQVLIFVINRQSFGWTLQAHWPWIDMALLGGAVLLLGSGISYAAGRFHMARWRKGLS
jgi:putative ABC transport system permease protein